MTPQELKASILQLAIQGKLVEQRPEEGTGEELLEKILATSASAKASADKKNTKDTKKNSRAEAPRRRGKTDAALSREEIPDSEKPFDIPESWVWVRLGELLKVIGGVSYEKKDVCNSGLRILRGGNIQNMEILLDDADVFLPEQYRDDEKIIRVGDILIVASTGSKTVIGKAGYIDKPIPQTMIGAFLRICRPSSLEFVGYLRIIFESDFYRKHIRELSQGTNINNIKEAYITQFAIPLPPLAEQKRIVAKIEELLPYIDRYEKAWSKLEDFNKRFPGDMQRSLLQMAIQGKLVDQRPEEGTGEELAHALRLKKSELIQSGQIAKKAKTKPFYTQEKLCEYGIPDTWCWVQLSDVSVIQEGAGIRKWQYRDNGIQILCVTNILEGAIDLERKKLFISKEEYLGKYRHLTPQKGDIVSACSGGSWGKTAIFDCSDTMMLNTSTLRLRFFGDLASNGYLYYLTKSAFFKKQLERQLAGMQPNFGYAHYSRIMFPLPPLAEQKRIVAKLEELLPLCERLK